MARINENELNFCVKLFKEEKYFECHECMETLWLTAKGPLKIQLQGLIQAAAGFYKLKNNHKEGGLVLLERARKKLQLPDSNQPELILLTDLISGKITETIKSS